jgi:hypothetical protein
MAVFVERVGDGSSTGIAGITTSLGEYHHMYQECLNKIAPSSVIVIEVIEKETRNRYALWKVVRDE